MVRKKQQLKRKSTATCDAVEKRTGKDGKARRLPKKVRISTGVALQRAAERRALQLAVLCDRERGRALRGEKVDWRQLVALEAAASAAAAVLVEKGPLA